MHRARQGRIHRGGGSTDRTADETRDGRADDAGQIRPRNREALEVVIVVKVGAVLKKWHVRP